MLASWVLEVLKPSSQTKDPGNTSPYSGGASWLMAPSRGSKLLPASCKVLEPHSGDTSLLAFWVLEVLNFIQPSMRSKHYTLGVHPC